MEDRFPSCMLRAAHEFPKRVKVEPLEDTVRTPGGQEKDKNSGTKAVKAVIVTDAKEGKRRTNFHQSRRVFGERMGGELC